jgi:hypothetical protein
MDFFIDLLKITIPALIVAISSYFIIKKLSDSANESKKLRGKSIARKDIMMLRLQAYERLILLMERITPDNLIMRIDPTGMNANEYHLELLSNIRAEFDHNISQQLYVSDLVWQEISSAKEEVTRLINFAFQQLDDLTLLSINKKIIDVYIKSELPTLKAITSIKAEARQLF